MTRDAIDRIIWQSWIDDAPAGSATESSALHVPSTSHTSAVPKLNKGKQAVGVKRARGKSKCQNLIHVTLIYLVWIKRN